MVTATRAWTSSLRPLPVVLIVSTILANTANAQTPILGFFGQTPAADPSLAAMCDRGYYTMIALSFLNEYGYLPLHLDLGAYQCDVPDSGVGYNNSGCATLEQDISHCQSRGVSILLGMGGCVEEECGGNYTFENAQQANDTATNIWNTYLSENTNGGNLAGTVARPLGNAILDGIAIDVENNMPADNPDQSWYNVFVDGLLAFNQNLSIVGTPQCYIGGDPRNPMEAMVSNVPFDYLMIQFYNDQRCSFRRPEFTSILNTWMNLNNSATPSMQLLLGAPGDAKSFVKNAGSTLLSGGELGALFNQYRNVSARNPVTGIALWTAEDDTRLMSDLTRKLATPWDTSSATNQLATNGLVLILTFVCSLAFMSPL